MNETLSASRIADFLRDQPDFFQTHAEVFVSMRVPAPHGGRAVSLVERQLLAVKDKVRSLEMKLAEMIRAGQENDATLTKIADWTHTLIAARDATNLPQLVETGILTYFNVPHVALRLWQIDTPYIHLPCASSVAPDVITFTNGLMAPYCGPNSGFSAANWLPDPILSLAMLPLRTQGTTQTFGLLVLGSPDPQRFTSSMGTELLVRIGQAASGALSRLLPEPSALSAGHHA